MDRNRFEELVGKALDRLPEEFAERLDSIDVVVEDWPSAEQLSTVGLTRRQDLLGLYEGVPLTRRSSWIGSKLPDKITVFQKPIEIRSRSEAQVIRLVREVVYHEIGHYFGISDKRLAEIQDDKEQNGQD